MRGQSIEELVSKIRESVRAKLTYYSYLPPAISGADIPPSIRSWTIMRAGPGRCRRFRLARRS